MLAPHKMMDEIKITLIPQTDLISLRLARSLYLRRKDEHWDDFLAFAGAKQIKIPCFTFRKHVSHLVWQLHVTRCVIIVDVIPDGFLAGQ